MFRSETSFQMLSVALAKSEFIKLPKLSQIPKS